MLETIIAILKIILLLLKIYREIKKYL